MMRAVKRILLLFVLLFIASETRAVAAPCTPNPISAAQNGRLVVITVDWEGLAACDKKADVNGRVSIRITEDTQVDVKVVNFNFIAYTASYKVDETVVESYVALEKLWKQLLGLAVFPPVGPAPAAAGCNTFDTCLARWANLISRTNIQLDAFRGQHVDKVALDLPARNQVEANQAALLVARTAVGDALMQLVDNHEPLTLQHVTQFETVYARQQVLYEKLDAYVSAAMRVKNGEVHHLGKKKAGTIVSVEITPKDQAGAAQSPIASLEYFSHSRIPLTFHLGYAYSALKEVKFESVRSLSQADLFAKVKSNDNVSSMLALLSLGRNFRDDNVGLHVSIGTDFSTPGERLYVGGSVQLLKRLFFTIGLVSATQEIGEGGVTERFLDQAGNLTGSRELFAAIKTHRSWDKGFGAISFRVF